MNNSKTGRRWHLEKGVVDSLIGEKTPIAVGTFNYVIAAVICAVSAVDAAFYGFAFCALGAGLWRLIQQDIYSKSTIVDGDFEALDRWRSYCLVAGFIFASLLGAMGFYALVFTQDSFAQIVSVTIAIANCAGISARNFGSHRYVVLQVIGLGVPLVVGLIWHGDVLHWVLSGLYLTFLLAIVKMSDGLRRVLHSAIEGREDVTRLASEMSTAMEIMPNGLMMFDDENRLKVINKRAARLLGIDNKMLSTGERPTIDEIIDKAIAIFQPENAMKNFVRTGFQGADSEKPQGELRLTHPDGRVYKFLSRRDASGNFLIRIDDISREERDTARIKDMSRFDQLTGLLNRNEMLVRGNTLVTSLSKTQSVMISVINLAGFKAVNNIHGSDFGDALLQYIGKRLQGVVGPRDLCSRFASDEFVVMMVLDHCSDNLLKTVISDLENAVNDTFTHAGKPIDVKSCIGVAVDAMPYTKFDQLLEQADFALTKAKSAQAASTIQFHPDMKALLERDRRLKVDLRLAVSNNELTSAYQPIVDCQTGQVVDFEALCRWSHPTLGPVSPVEFIELAEELGIISDITRNQLMNACMAAKRLPESVGVSVNLSARDFNGPYLLEYIRTALNVSAIDPRRLTVEVTETSLLDLERATIRKLEDIRAMGIAIALDDFGTGYSSLDYLHKLPLDRLKIDRSLVTGVESNPKLLKMLKSVASLARDLELDLVIEGIETEVQRDLILNEVGADMFQGYLFSQPLPESAIVDYCQRAFPALRTIAKAQPEKVERVA